MLSDGFTRLDRGRTLPSTTYSPLHAVHAALRIDHGVGGVVAATQRSAGVRRAVEADALREAHEASLASDELERAREGAMLGGAARGMRRSS